MGRISSEVAFAILVALAITWWLGELEAAPFAVLTLICFFLTHFIISGARWAWERKK